MHKIQHLTGNWLLRSTNNYNYKTGNTILHIDYNNNVYISNKYNKGILGYTNKKYAKYDFYDKENKIDLYFTDRKQYIHSVSGVQTSHFNIIKEELFNSTLSLEYSLDIYNNKLYFYDNLRKHHYLFDLYVEELNIHKIDTTLNNFIFLQLFTFLIDTLLTISLKHTILNNIF